MHIECINVLTSNQHIKRIRFCATCIVARGRFWTHNSRQKQRRTSIQTSTSADLFFSKAGAATLFDREQVTQVFFHTFAMHRHPQIAQQVISTCAHNKKQHCRTSDMRTWWQYQSIGYVFLQSVSHSFRHFFIFTFFWTCVAQGSSCAFDYLIYAFVSELKFTPTLIWRRLTQHCGVRLNIAAANNCMTIEICVWAKG